MRIFYIDFENVKNSGLNGISKLDCDDIVRIYYSEDADKITFGTHRRIIESPAKFEYRRMNNNLKGVKNALDVLLMNDLSSRINEEQNADFYIVSKDGDYDGYIEEQQKRRIPIWKLSEVCQAWQHNNSAELDTAYIDEIEKKEQRFKSHFGKYLKNDYNDNRDEILQAYLESESRQELNRNLQKYFYNDAVSDIFKRMGTLIKDMPGR